MKRYSRTRANERGNVLIYILIAVALLGALSFAVAQSGRGNVQQLSAERARLYAAGIVEYADNLSKTVSQLQLRGCAEDELNFANTIVAGYTNGSAPSDGFCDIFSPSGGGLSWQKIAPEVVDTTNNYLSDYLIFATNQVSGTKSNEGDLIFLAEVNESVCTAINELINVSPADPPATDANGFNLNTGFKFSGSYSSTAGITAYSSENAACFYSAAGTNTTDRYYFYKILISR